MFFSALRSAEIYYASSGCLISALLNAATDPGHRILIVTGTEVTLGPISHPARPRHLDGFRPRTCGWPLLVDIGARFQRRHQARRAILLIIEQTEPHRFIGTQRPHPACRVAQNAPSPCSPNLVHRVRVVHDSDDHQQVVVVLSRPGARMRNSVFNKCLSSALIEHRSSAAALHPCRCNQRHIAV